MYSRDEVGKGTAVHSIAVPFLRNGHGMRDCVDRKRIEKVGTRRPTESPFGTKPGKSALARAASSSFKQLNGPVNSILRTLCG